MRSKIAGCWSQRDPLEATWVQTANQRQVALAMVDTCYTWRHSVDQERPHASQKVHVAGEPGGPWLRERAAVSNGSVSAPKGAPWS